MVGIKITDTITGALERLTVSLPEVWDMAMEQYAIEAGIYTQTYILDAIAEGHPIGHFMGPRTEIQVMWVGRGINHKMLVLRVGGIPEGRVVGQNNAQNPVNPHDNLWEVHEYGMNYIQKRYPMNGRAMVIPFADGIKFASSAGPIEINKYIGRVSGILEQIRTQLYATLLNLASQVAVRLMEDLELKTGIKLVGSGVIDWLKANNLNTLALKNLGVSRMDSKSKITSGGLLVEQIYARDKAGRFMSLGMDTNYRLIYRP